MTKVGRLLGSDATTVRRGRGSRLKRAVAAARHHEFSFYKKAVLVVERLSRVALWEALALYHAFGLSIFSIGIMIRRYIFFRIRGQTIGDDLVVRLRATSVAPTVLAKSSIEAAVVRRSSG